MRVLLPFVFAAAFLPGAAAAVEPDPQVKAHLGKLDYQYELTDDGDYKVVFRYDEDGRTQMVFVGSAVETYGQHRIREVWSAAYEGKDGKLPADVANRLLAASSDLKLGAWTKAGDYAVFVVKLPADASAEALDDAMEVAGVSADNMEAELTPGKDDF